EAVAPFAPEGQAPRLRADLADDVEQIGVELPSPAPGIGLADPAAIGNRHDDRLGRITEPRRQRLEDISVDVGRAARIESLEVGAADHRIEQRYAKTEAQEIGLVGDALQLEPGAISVVEVPDARGVDMAAPFMAGAGL